MRTVPIIGKAHQLELVVISMTEKVNKLQHFEINDF